MKIKDLLTIVIPCKNEGLIIKKTLELLNNQENIKGTNIIVADSSNDKWFTHGCIESQYNKNLLIKIINGGYPAIARNNGASHAKTKYVLFLDADMFITEKDLLTKLLKKMEDKKLHLLTTRIRTEDKKFNYAYKTLDTLQSVIKYTTPFAVGGFMLFKKDIFDELGRFNVKDKFAEDYHLSSKIKPKKFNIDKHIVYTTSRRFEKKGILYMMNMMVKSYLNTNNDEFFEKNHDYWA